MRTSAFMMMVGTGAAITSSIGSPIRPFSEEKCDNSNEGDVFVTGMSCSCSMHIKGSAVHIEEGFDSQDKLECPACQQLGIQATYANGKLYLDNDRPFSDYAAALASVEFTAASVGTRKVVMNYGHALYSRKNQHFYSYNPYGECDAINNDRSEYDSNEFGATWVEAQTCCADKKNDMFGLAGYLMTITSAEEQAIAESKLDGRGWMGASDSGKERTWRWVTGPEGCAPYDLDIDGPERTSCDIYPYIRNVGRSRQCGGPSCRNKGTLIGWQHNPSGFSNANGMYSNWKNNEPNNFCTTCPGDCVISGEDFGHFYADGGWNDYPNYHQIEGYMCEWGDIGDRCIHEAHLSREIDITGQTCNPNDTPAEFSIVNPDTNAVHKQQALDVTLGMSAWTGATISHLPKYLTPVFSSTQIAVAFTSDQIAEGKILRVTCPDTCDAKDCDFYITHYLCPPCESKNGNLPAYLMSAGWGAGSCAPKFTEGGEQYDMVAFRRRLSAGESIDIPALESDLEKYMVFGITQVESCGDCVEEDECGARSGCSWKGNQCTNDWCPKPAGPPAGNRCNVCAPFN
eukprot:TRINITY_DN5888_c0_g1_i1.p1 TRINITY_DN5888_c0_g1~~TRINITY_DN5888_c0_g1_i1.p1  ORF type:complete len:593 (+),score=148.73 TRINITY_DN5888_c0_g1_i1:69-1781(+)